MFVPTGCTEVQSNDDAPPIVYMLAGCTEPADVVTAIMSIRAVGIGVLVAHSCVVVVKV